MSPRSEEFLAEARARLAVTRTVLDQDSFSVAVSLAYYAALYAARAALSEEDLYAKTHSGTWNLFHVTYVETQRFEAELAAVARDLQPLREGADYDAATISREQAEDAVEAAERFV